MERAPRLEGSGCGVELREVATPLHPIDRHGGPKGMLPADTPRVPCPATSATSAGSSSWCADDLVRIPGLGAGSKGMRTGASAHHSRRGCGRGRPRTTVEGDATGASAHHSSAAKRPARSVGERSPAPSLRADHGARRNSLDTGLSRHREVEQISRGHVAATSLDVLRAQDVHSCVAFLTPAGECAASDRLRSASIRVAPATRLGLECAVVDMDGANARSQGWLCSRTHLAPHASLAWRSR